MTTPAIGPQSGGRERFEALIAFLQQEQQRIHAAERRHHQQLDDLEAEEEAAVLDLVAALTDCCKAGTPAEAQEHMSRFQELQQQLTQLHQRSEAFFSRVDAHWPGYTGRFEAAIEAHLKALRAPPPPQDAAPLT